MKKTFAGMVVGIPIGLFFGIGLFQIIEIKDSKNAILTMFISCLFFSIIFRTQNKVTDKILGFIIKLFTNWF
jgi:uncharacterized membrane protein YccC